MSVNDIDKYIDSDPIMFAFDKNIDQTKWLRNQQAANRWQFPLIAKAARDYLAIPPSEVDIERLFSEGRDIIGVRRWALDGDTISILMKLKDQKRREKEGY